MTFHKFAISDLFPLCIQAYVVPYEFATHCLSLLSQKPLAI